MPDGLILDPVGIREVIYSPTGPVARHLIHVAELIQERAKEKVGYSDRTAILGDQRKPRTGPHLRDTIVRGFSIGAEGPVVTVGSDLPYAEYHHEPQPGRMITSDGVMVFPGEGGWIFTHSVNHPAWAGNPYLRAPMEEVIGGGLLL